MANITIALPDEDFAFLQEYSAANGVSAEAVLARQARSLREHVQRPLRPEVIAVTGIIDPAVDAVAAYRAHLEFKYM